MGKAEEEKSLDDREDFVGQKTPLVFISHDSRDAELAEAFSKLLRSVTAGTLKSFRSSDKTGKEGIDYGDEWYKQLMLNLDSASDVVCLFTERSLERPWILYEAGVAKGKMNTPVHGVALGVPLRRISIGPFYQFQNCDDSEESLSALVMQLAERVPNVEPEPDVVKMQVEAFKTKTAEILANLSDSEDEDGQVDNSSVAKLFEELKIMLRDLPPRIENKLSDGSAPIRSRRMRRFDARMIPELASMVSRHPLDPVGIIFAVSFLRDDFPWIYEIGMEAYQAVKSDTQEEARDSLMRFQRTIGLTFHGPFLAKELMISKEDYTALRELEEFLDSIITNCLEKLPASDEQGKYRRTILVNLRGMALTKIMFVFQSDGRNGINKIM